MLTGEPDEGDLHVRFGGRGGAIPTSIKSCHLPEDPEDMEEECARHFFVNSAALLAAMAAKIDVHQKTVEVFTQLVQLELFKAQMDPGEVAKVWDEAAQKAKLGQELDWQKAAVW